MGKIRVSKKEYVKRLLEWRRREYQIEGEDVLAPKIIPIYEQSYEDLRNLGLILVDETKLQELLRKEALFYQNSGYKVGNPNLIKVLKEILSDD